MDFDTQLKIKELRENLAKSITAARDFAKQQREHPERHSELEEKFRRAHKEAAAIKNELQALEMQDAAEQEVEPSLRGRIIYEPHQGSAEAHAAAFRAYLRAHAQDGAVPMAAMERAAGVGPEEINAMLSSDDELGGFAVPEDFRAEILKDLAGRVVVRAAGARVVQTSGKEVFWPAISGSAEADPNDNKMYTSQIQKRSANWKAEGHTVGGAAIPTQTVPLGGERIPINLWQPDVIEVTRELLADSAGNLEAALQEVIRETRALDEDYAFPRGTGVGEPEGILSASNSVARVNVGDASAYAAPAAGDNGVSYPRMVNIYTDLAAQYRRNATWIFNSDTFGLILK